MSRPKKSTATSKVIKVGGQRIQPGMRAHIDIQVARLANGDWLSLPIEVLNGVSPGPHLWLSGAIHGDEVVGVAIAHRVLQTLDPMKLSGVVIAAPIVNVFGFIAESRYLPDRRDLNRSFPGHTRGSMASQLASLFMKEVVGRCDYGIDLHAGSDDRTNLPQIRANLDDPETMRLAAAFGAPVMIHGRPPKGSLRAAACKRGKTVLLFEGGEPRRFEDNSVNEGACGVLRVMRALEMCNEIRPTRKRPVISRTTRWVRATRGGILWLKTERGRRVREGQLIGVITGPYGREREDVRARMGGLVIGHTVSPFVHRGDALVHIAETESP
jgi:uncharacterized protein